MVVSEPYPPIGSYALIGNGNSAALVSDRASIDWCCLPRVDSASVFGRLLDWERGGFCQLEPAVASYDSSHDYIDGTLVHVTRFYAAGGEARLYDCFAISDPETPAPRAQLIRVVEGLRGSMDFTLTVCPRFDYGEIEPWVRHHAPSVYSATGGNDSILVTGDLDLRVVGRHDIGADFTVRAGERTRIAITYYRPEEIESGITDDLSPETTDARLRQAIDWWRDWSGKLNVEGTFAPEVKRSAIVLRAMVNPWTGAVVAAPTTSLPESPGGARNWDYRYSWIRDAQFTVRSLTELGATAEADAFRRFVQRSSAGSAESLQIMYGVGGERRLTELEVDMDGYRGARPVRIGNAASDQIQLDVFGYIADLTWRWHQRGRSPDDDYWRFLLSLVDHAIELWEEPDCGIWEMRGKPQHFVHSKVMCWATVDRGIRLARACLRQAPLARWERAAREMRRTIERRGYDRKRGVFVQAFGGREMDAALLLLPTFDFVPYDDERMVRTVDAIWHDLDDEGLIRRYRSDDQLPGSEGVFVACSFWLAECLMRQGREADARSVFDRAMSASNELGLFAEEFDPQRRELLGNFPQCLTHLSHIAAALTISRGAQVNVPIEA